MLNELLIMEDGARFAGIQTEQQHRDIKTAGKKPTLRVQLDEDGRVVAVAVVPRTVVAWTLRDGLHNSFPFVQPKSPLWVPPTSDKTLDYILDRKTKGRREKLLSTARTAQVNENEYGHWPGSAMIERLGQRQGALCSLMETDAAVVPATISRFLLACNNPIRFVCELTSKVLASLARTAEDDLLDVAIALLVGEKEQKSQEWRCTGALLFEASGCALSIVDHRLVRHVTMALSNLRQEGAANASTVACGLTGCPAPLLVGNFPQPNLPVLGQTWLFAKNKDIPASERYGRTSNEAMPVGEEIVRRLDGVLRALTHPSRKNKTWRAIPRDVGVGADLMVAFVKDAPEERPVEILAEDDLSSEEGDETVDLVARFEVRTKRLVETIRGEMSNALNSEVQLMVLRRVDQANRKVVYSGLVTVADLNRSCQDWAAGERNVPSWLLLPVSGKVERASALASPPHVAPLGLIAFSKAVFIRGGTERQDVSGLSAAEALGIFLRPAAGSDNLARKRLMRVLRLVLERRTGLAVAAVHALRRPANRGQTKPKKHYDHREVLRAATVLAVLLHKLNRVKEMYMNDTAFLLGQLLSAADVVHAGYCADRRDGRIPPSLIGNQVFAMAQRTPARALAVLCRRWKPYDGWAKQAVRDPQRANGLMASKNKEEQQRGWDIKKALRHAREIGPMATRLAPALDGCRADDVFIAELLLGYLAGLPKAEQREPDSTREEENLGREESL